MSVLYWNLKFFNNSIRVLQILIDCNIFIAAKRSDSLCGIAFWVSCKVIDVFVIPNYEVIIGDCVDARSSHNSKGQWTQLQTNFSLNEDIESFNGMF